MRETAARVVVVGSFVQACCWKLEHLPRPGETALAPGFATEPAGKGLAVAVGCRRLGAPVDVLLAIGTDIAGDELLRLLVAEDIAGTHVHRKGPYSGHGAGLIDAAGENVIAVYPGANHALGLAEVEQADAAIAQAALVYGQLEAPPAAVVNTLGAGDAFSSGLCFALAGGAPVLQALRSGNACGAYAVNTPGILDGLASQAVLENLFRPAT